MKPEIKKLWIEALRSGQYEQGRCTLCRVESDDDSGGKPYNHYCCLGVLCELYRKEHEKDCRWSENLTSSGVRQFLYDFDDEYADVKAEEEILPPPVREWADLEVTTSINRSNPLLTVNGREFHLSALNDGVAEKELYSTASEVSRRLSFTELADLIEAQL